MSPLAQASRTLTRRAKDLTVRTWSEGALDSYRDPVMTEDTTLTLKGWVELKETPTFIRDPMGEQVQIEASIFVLENSAISWSDAVQKPEIIDEDGAEYVVQLVGKKENGIRELYVREMRV